MLTSTFLSSMAISKLNCLIPLSKVHPLNSKVALTSYNFSHSKGHSTRPEKVRYLNIHSKSDHNVPIEPFAPNDSTVPEPTFSTVSEDLDVIVHTDDLALLRQRQSNDDRREFLHLIVELPPPRSKTSFQRSIHFVHSVPRSDAASLSGPDLATIIDRLLNGKKVTLTDPQSVAAVIKELDVRRVDALSNSRYLESKKIGDIIDELKLQLYESDREMLFRENAKRLEELHREAIDAHEAAQRFWKERRHTMLDDHKREMVLMQERHQAEHTELEGRWSDPAAQRRFSKRSSQLLHQRAVEKYMVLAGQLEDAEHVKRINQRNEHKEVQAKYQDMLESFESARAKLIADQVGEADRIRREHDFRWRNLLKDEGIAMEVCRKGWLPQSITSRNRPIWIGFSPKSSNGRRIACCRSPCSTQMKTCRH
jgi:hypothetical protein